MSLHIQAPRSGTGQGNLVMCRMYDDVADNTHELNLGIMADGRISVHIEDRDAGTIMGPLAVHIEDVAAALHVLTASAAGGVTVTEDE